MTDNVIPEQELARRRRVHELAARMTSAMEELAILEREIGREATSDGIPLEDVRELVIHGLSASSGMTAADIRASLTLWAPAQDDEEEHVHISPWKALLDRLFGGAPTIPGATAQAPALECSVILRSFPTPFAGVLSVTAEGMLRLMYPHQVPQKGPGGISVPPRLAMIEQFFELDDIVSLGVIRDVTQEGSKLTVS